MTAKEAAALPRDVKETVVQIDHDTKRARVWTCNRGVRNKLARAGYPQVRKQAEGVWFEVPAKAISFRKPAKKRPSARTDGAVTRTARERRESGAATAEPPRPQEGE